MAKAAEFCCFQELGPAPLVLLHYHQLSVFQLLHCLSLAVLELALQTVFELRDLYTSVSWACTTTLRPKLFSILNLLCFRLGLNSEIYLLLSP